MHTLINELALHLKVRMRDRNNIMNKLSVCIEDCMYNKVCLHGFTGVRVYLGLLHKLYREATPQRTEVSGALTTPPFFFLEQSL